MEKIKKFFKKKRKTILSLAGSLAMLLVAGGIGVFVALYQNFSPDKYMKEFYDCFLNESYAAMYKSAGVEESEFINLNSFTQMMVNDLGYEETDKYNISDLAKDGEMVKSTISFVDSETEETVEWDLKLEKSKDKKYLFFNEWQVNLDEFIVEDINIVAATEVEVLIDDANITSEEIEGVSKTIDEETGMVTYVIDRMFAGSHTIIFMGTHTETESVIATFNQKRKYYAFREGVLKAEEQETMNSSVKNIVVEMYNSVFSAAGAENLLTMFSTKSGVSYNVVNTYSQLARDVNKEDGSVLNSIDITDYSVTFEPYKFNSTVDVKFKYTASFTAKGERTIADGVRDRYEGVANGEAVVTYEYIDGTWQAVNIVMECIDYSQPEETEE